MRFSWKGEVKLIGKTILHVILYNSSGNIAIRYLTRIRSSQTMFSKRLLVQMMFVHSGFHLSAAWFQRKWRWMVNNLCSLFFKVGNEREIKPYWYNSFVELRSWFKDGNKGILYKEFSAYLFKMWSCGRNYIYDI